MHPLERTLLRALARHADPASPVVAACSAGADSTALAALLAAARDRGAIGPVVLAHLDHGVRGPAAAAADRAAVEALGLRLGVRVVCGRADAPAERARRGRGSLEAACRAVRYAFLAQVARDVGAAVVCTGHTADDQAETVLLRALRGAGLHGLAGMPRRRRLAPGGPWLLRPLLQVGRAALRAHLTALDLAWVEDPTNADPAFLRNRLRAAVLPALRRDVNPRVDEALVRLAANARQAARDLGRAARALLRAAALPGSIPGSIPGPIPGPIPGAGWDLATLAAATPAVRALALRRVARRACPDRLDARHLRALDRAVRAGAGAVALPGGATALVAGGRLLLTRPAAPAPPLAVDVVPRVVAAGADRLAGAPGAAAPVAWLDADRAHGAIGVRARRPGDRFWPLGGPGTRSIKRFLIDHKVPRPARAGTPIVTLDDRPIWIVGHRIDERYKVTPETARILELRIAPSGEKEWLP